MTIETATNIYDLNSSLPADGDEQAEGDDHIRMIKAALKATLPGLGGALGRTSSKAISFTPGVTENTCFFHCTAGVTLSLLAIAGVPDGTFYVVNASGGAVVIDPNGTELVNGATTVTLPQGYWALVAKAGTAWSAMISAGTTTPTMDAQIHAATTKTPPVDADEFGFWDSVSSALRKCTWANVKSTLKTYFDTLYMATVAPGTSGNILTSNGTAWTSAAAPAAGVTSVGGNTGAVTNAQLKASVEAALGFSIGNTANLVPKDVGANAIGSFATGVTTNSGGSAHATIGSTYAASATYAGVSSGTWRCTGNNVAGGFQDMGGSSVYISVATFQRIS